MMQISLLILLELKEYSEELYFTIVNSIGRGYHYSNGDNVSRTELWMIPKARKEMHEIITQLKAIEAVRTVSLVVIEGSAKLSDLKEVRRLFAAYGWDAGGISDQELLLYMDSVFQLQNTYYIDFEFSKFGTGLDRIFIKPTIENPDFSATDNDKIKKWMQDEEELTPGNMHSITVSDVQTVSINRAELPIQNVRKMNDVQIRQWILEHYSDVKNEDIEIERTSGTLTVIIKSNNSTSTFLAPSLK